jgi:glycerate dehydrogenase
VSLHLASNSQTEGFVNQHSFGQMKDGVILLNTARGELVVEQDMMAALQSGKISAAGLDVFHDEPVAPDHPILKLDNVVLSPHVGFNTPEAVYRLFDIGVTNLEKYFAGEPVNRVKS